MIHYKMLIKHNDPICSLILIYVMIDIYILKRSENLFNLWCKFDSSYGITMKTKK